VPLLRGACVAMLAACWQPSGAPAMSAEVPRLLSCAGPLRPDATAASLARAFGAGAVSSTEIERLQLEFADGMFHLGPLKGRP
jgi:hypothetical protein